MIWKKKSEKKFNNKKNFCHRYKIKMSMTKVSFLIFNKKEIANDTFLQ